MKNWKTTLFGGTSGVMIAIAGILTQNWSDVVLGIGMILVGLFAKDAGVSGTDF